MFHCLSHFHVDSLFTWLYLYPVFFHLCGVYKAQSIPSWWYFVDHVQSPKWRTGAGCCSMFVESGMGYVSFISYDNELCQDAASRTRIQSHQTLRYEQITVEEPSADKWVLLSMMFYRYCALAIGFPQRDLMSCLVSSQVLTSQSSMIGLGHQPLQCCYLYHQSLSLHSWFILIMRNMAGIYTQTWARSLLHLMSMAQRIVFSQFLFD